MTTRCILFADVVGSTALYEKLGDAEAQHAVGRCIKRLHLVVTQKDGRVVKTIGDGLLADFADATTTIAAASEMQQRIADLPPVAGQHLSVRIAFHHGPVIVEDGDIFGDSVNLAARLVELARPGQILASTSTINTLPALARQSARALPAMSVKGKSEPIDICEVVWRDDGDMTLVSAGDFNATQSPAAPAPAPRVPRLILRYADTLLFEMTATSEALLIGRDKDCGLTVLDPRASRQHASIVSRSGKFVLIDQSTNGTWLAREGETEVTLHREDAPLLGQGRISLGHPANNSADCIHYELV
jgi:adenylate cyclase